MRNRLLYYSNGCEVSNDISQLVIGIINQIDSVIDGNRVLRIVFFGAADNNTTYLNHRNHIETTLRKIFGDKMPVWSYVAQPPFECELAAEVWWCSNSEWIIKYKQYKDKRQEDNYGGETPYITLQRGDSKRIIAGGLNALSDTHKTTILEQSQNICSTIASIMAEENMPLNSIVRQWNYIERITFEDENSQHYQDFNDARSELYGRTAWENGYPAATGIGTISGGIVIDFDAAVGEPIVHINNELQVAAHAYSKDLLIGEASKKTTPKFERAKLCGDLLYISGTAAIRGEESLTGIMAAEQSVITLENIDELIRCSKCGKAISLRVYIKYREDYEQIREVVERYSPNNALYIFADICRDELLVEIEAIAYKR